MPLANLTLKHIITPNPFRFTRQKLFSINTSHVAFKKNLSMADEASKQGGSQILNVENEKKMEKSTPSIPPPPEKPLPDDCCGSGCVRCVWDVYYDELEAYNKLYGNTSNNSDSNVNSKTDESK